MRRLICVFGCLIVSWFGEAKCVKSALEFCTINSDADACRCKCLHSSTNEVILDKGEVHGSIEDFMKGFEP